MWHFTMGFSGHGAISQRLVLMILEIFPSLNDSVIVAPGMKGRELEFHVLMVVFAWHLLLHGSSLGCSRLPFDAAFFVPCCPQPWRTLLFASWSPSWPWRWWLPRSSRER